MNPIYLGLGIALVVLATIDLFWTTLWVDGGAGPVSSRLSTGIWRGMRRAGGEHRGMLSLGGPIILLLTLATWVGLIWVGWTFVFAGAHDALIDTRTGEPVTWLGRFHFVGYSMFTSGSGDFAPSHDGWRVAASLVTASGMMYVTLGISYVLSVLSAVVDKRSFAASVTGLGTRSEAVVLNGWDGEGFAGLDLPINDLSSDLARLAEQHEAYPILHYYHSEQEAASSAMAVAVFDEATTLLEYGIPEEHRPNRVLLESVSSSTDSYLQTLSNAFISPAAEPPPPPDLDRLRADDVPTVPDDEFESVMRGLSERRRKLRGMVDADAREWPPVDTQ